VAAVDDVTADEFQEEKMEPSPAFQRFAGRVLENPQLSLQEVQQLVVDNESSKPETKFEYPLQKYSRLKEELLDLEKQLKQLTQLAESNGEEPTKHIIKQVNEDIKNAWENVEQLKNNPRLTPLFGEAQTSMVGAMDSKYLLKRLQEFQTQKSKTGDNTQQQQQQTDQSVLTLCHDGSRDGKSYEVKEISERLDSLEALVGSTSENISNSKGGMTRNVEYLTKRLEQLSDQNRLSTLKKKAEGLKDVFKDMGLVAQNTVEDQSKVKDQKINQMFDMMERWDQASHALPAIVTRLKDLKNLHEESADMPQKVNSLGNQRNSIAQTLGKNAQVLQQVNESLVENAKIMQTNAQGIEQKMLQLQQQIQKL